MVGKRSATQGHPAAGPSAKQVKKACLSMFWWVGVIQRCHRSLFPRRTRPVFARIGRFFRPFSSVFCTECANPLRWVHRWVGEATIIPMVTLSTRPPSSLLLLLPSPRALVLFVVFQCLPQSSFPFLANMWKIPHDHGKLWIRFWPANCR